jgi:hypothetical protein
MSVKSNGNKYRLSVRGVESSFLETFINSCTITVIITEQYFVAEIAKVNGLENIMDLNHTPITQDQVQNANIIGMTFGKGILRLAMDR